MAWDACILLLGKTAVVGARLVSSFNMKEGPHPVQSLL
jgi:hypothetical protein